MTAEYSFEKKSIVILLSSTFILFMLIFFLGLLTGLNIERSNPEAQKQIETVGSSSNKNESVQAGTAVKVDTKNPELVTETKPKAASPEFKEVAPTAELPNISQPKTD
ncbi:hypothetical protein KJ966_04850 [bacterium]|nr:hypothetical protein [bacterium]